MVYVTAVHMSDNGTSHEHIEYVRWRQPSDGSTGESSVASMVTFIENNGVAKTSGPPEALIGVWTASSGRQYIRTYADGTWTNNLLDLPRY